MVQATDHLRLETSKAVAAVFLGDAQPVIQGREIIRFASFIA